MSIVKENKKTNIIPVILALFFFLRGVLLADRKHIGIDSLYPFKMAFSAESIVFVVLLLLYAALAALVIGKISKEFGESATYISVLLVAEPLFFAKYDNCIVLFIAVLAFAFILNALREKPIVPNEITLIVFLLVTTVLSENAIFLFVLPAIIAYFVSDAKNIIINTKKLVMLILSLVSVAAGILLNDYLTENVSAFDNFVKTYSFFEHVYFKHIEYENALLLIFAIPMLILGIYFIKELAVNNADKEKIGVYLIAGFIAVAYILSVTGFFLRGSAALFTINYIVPIAIFALVKNKNSAAVSALGKVNTFISGHTLAFISVAIFMCFVAARVFLENEDSIASYILSI